MVMQDLMVQEITDLYQGVVLDNETLRQLFLCSGQGGMRRSKKTGTLVIVSNHVKSIYDDRWEGNILHYTGMGSEGDQSFDSNQNKTLSESNENGVAVHFFEVFKEKEYTYVGQVKLAGLPYTEQQMDKNNKMRSVCVFPLRLVDAEHFVLKEDINNIEDVRSKSARKLSDEELLEKAEHARKTAEPVQQVSKGYKRNMYVSENAKRRANGICQLCLNLAPFRDHKSEPYLETHHIVWLAQGGDDSIENTVALCPNCHRKMHIVNDLNDIKKLQEAIK